MQNTHSQFCNRIFVPSCPDAERSESVLPSPRISDPCRPLRPSVPIFQFFFFIHPANFSNLTGCCRNCVSIVNAVREFRYVCRITDQWPVPFYIPFSCFFVCFFFIPFWFSRSKPSWMFYFAGLEGFVGTYIGFRFEWLFAARCTRSVVDFVCLLPFFIVFFIVFLDKCISFYCSFHRNSAFVIAPRLSLHGWRMIRIELPTITPTINGIKVSNVT